MIDLDINLTKVVHLIYKEKLHLIGGGGGGTLKKTLPNGKLSSC